MHLEMPLDHTQWPEGAQEAVQLATTCPGQIWEWGGVILLTWGACRAVLRARPEHTLGDHVPSAPNHQVLGR